MKILAVPIIALFVASQAIAFEPGGPPPQKTSEWTIRLISEVEVTRIDPVTDPMSLQDWLTHLRLLRGAPGQYWVKIDGSALGEAKLNAPLPLKFQVQSVKMIGVLAKIADAVNANLVIEPGLIRLVPRTQAEQAGAGQPTTKPADKPPVKDQPATPTSKDAPR